MPSLNDAIMKLAKDAAKLAEGSKIVGLGSGSTAVFVVEELAALAGSSKMEFVPTSLQIKIEAEKHHLRIADENRIPDIEIVFDGADQIDAKFNMIKGGGGALLREKILISAAKCVVILADESKFVSRLSRSVPVEVHPMARTSASRNLKEMGGTPVLRLLDKGYPFVSENGNVILDTTFDSIHDPKGMERDLKNIPGVMEAGIFTRTPDIFYKAKSNGTFEKILT